MSDTMTVGKKLVELCKAGKNEEALETLYSPDIVSVEAGPDSPAMPKRMEGLEAIKGKNAWWIANHDVLKQEVNGPFPNGDRFVVNFKMSVHAKSGPMAGKTFDMEEAGLYTVTDGKITQEEFFYSMG